MTPSLDLQHSEADDELLSAYIDNDLADADRTALEARLQREPALRSALDDLRATMALLHDLPQLTPPRSFTLDPALYRSRWQMWSAWLWRGSALAAVLLALTFTLTLHIGGSSSATTASSEPNVLTSAAAPTSATAAGAPLSAPAAPAAALSAPAATEAAGSGGSAADVASAVSSDAPMAAQKAPGATEAQTEQSIAEAPATSAPPLMESRAITDSGSSSPGTAALDQSAAQQSAQPAADTAQPAARRIAPLRALQIVLVVLIVLLGGAALWVTRRHAR